MMSAVAAKVLAGLGIAVAGAATAAQAGFAPGIATAFSHVPSWTHAASVLQWIQNSFAAGQHPSSPPSPPSHP